jgi:eukaryotic-like serine/threonine-protein kinase
MPQFPSTDRQTFLTNLRQSGLVGPDELAALAARLPETERGRLVARALVDQGVLTKFQAERLLVGITSGFVLGQYRILDQLGRGGMGRVFKAVHQTMNRVVALKVLAPHLVETQKAQLLFLREMRAVARLAHPNIVTAYDANQIGDRYYLVMEYVDGPSLERLVRDQGPLPIGLACELVRQVAEGLQYANELGMVHRDIKPSNLLVLLPGGEPRRKHYTVKILDFGLARLQSQTENDRLNEEVGTIFTRPSVVMGTPDFVSPEQAHDLHAADIRSDLYSLGCTFYFLLTGQVPFPDGTTLEKLLRHTTEEPARVEQLRREVPPEVAAIVRRLMAKEPLARFQTPADLIAGLEPFAVHGPLARPVPVPPSGGWSASASSPALPADPFATPSGGSDPDALFSSAFFPGDELSALASTLPPDLAATPLSETAFPVAAAGRTTPAERKKMRLAIGLAIGIIGLLIGLAALLWF